MIHSIEPMGFELSTFFKNRSFPQRVPVVRRTRQPSMFFRYVTDTNQSESHSGHPSNSASPEIIWGLGGPEEDHQLHHCCWTGRVSERAEEEDSRSRYECAGNLLVFVHKHTAVRQRDN